MKTVEKVEKFSRTKLNNLIKKLLCKMDFEGEFIPSIEIEIKSKVWADEHNLIENVNTEIFENDDVDIAICLPRDEAYNIKILARFGNGDGEIFEYSKINY